MNPEHWTAADWERFGEHAAIGSINAHMDRLQGRINRLERAMLRLEAIRRKRDGATIA